MAEQALVQVRVDSDLKRDVTEIYEELGMDLPTAIRMFLKRSKLVKGIPFDTTLNPDYVTRLEGLKAFEQLRKQAENVPEMSLDEINEEIRLARKERKSREA